MGGRKSPFPITLAIGLYTSLYYRTSRDKNTQSNNQSTGDSTNESHNPLNPTDEPANSVHHLVQSVTYFHEMNQLTFDLTVSYNPKILIDRLLISLIQSINELVEYKYIINICDLPYGLLISLVE